MLYKSSELKIFRQGDRSPLKWETYPNDMYPPMEDGTWPDGLGQLTNVRKMIFLYLKVL